MAQTPRTARAPLATGLRDPLLAVAAGLLLAASFVDFRLFILPWLALVPLIAIAERNTPRRAFALGMLAGLAGIAVAFSWLVHAMRVFGGFSTPVAFALYTAPVAWMALEFGLITGTIALLGPVPLGLAAPLAFTAIEFLYPSLFPWRLAHSQYRVPLLLQTGDLAGPSLLTFTMAWGSAAVTRLAGARGLFVSSGSRGGERGATGTRHNGPGGGRRMESVATVVAPALLLVALVAYGTWRLAAVRTARAAAPTLRVGVVQGNVGIEQKSDRAYFRRNLDDYRTLSRAIATDVEVVIWPETVVQHPLPAEATRLHGPEHPFPDTPRPLVFGGLAHSTRAGSRLLFNSAFLIRPDGTVGARYDKRILVPFGEYMPLGTLFPSLYRLSPATSNFAAGTAQVLLPVNAVARLAPLICYEDVIPGPAREAVARGATLLLNLTNDAWYGDTAEPVQHQALAMWRAVETRRDFVRATNTGLTSVISATGEVLATLPTFEAKTLAIETRLLSGTTVYAAVGDAFAWAVVAILAVLLLGRLRRSPRM